MAEWQHLQNNSKPLDVLKEDSKGKAPQIVEVDEPEEPERQKEIVLFKNNRKIFEIFLIARLYIDSDYKVDSNILLQLLKKENLSLKKSLRDFSFLYSSYLSTWLKLRKT